MYITVIHLGALTSKVSAYKYRSWELEIREVLDYFDSLGVIGNSCVKGLKIVRIIPSSNLFFDWISDKFRFSFDSLLENRCVRILYKQEELSLLESLQQGLLPILESSNIYFFFGKTLDMIEGVYIKNFSKILSKVNYITDSFFNLCNSNLDERAFKYMNFIELTSVKNLVIWGVDLRLEFPILEAFLLKKYSFDCVYSIGSLETIGFNLGSNFLSHLSNFINGTTLILKTILKKSALIFGGSGIFGRFSQSGLEMYIMLFIKRIKTIFLLNNLTFFLLNLFMSDLNIAEVGLLNKVNGGFCNDKNSLIFVCDNFDIFFLEKFNFSICFNSYNDNPSKNGRFCDLVLPIVFLPEKDYITNSLQGSLIYCEKVIKNKLINLTISNYLIYFMHIILLNFMLRNSVKFNKIISNKLLLNVFLVYYKFKKIIFLKKYLYKLAVNSIVFRKDLMFSTFLDISLQNIISNYFYTHINLVYSPTILLADARLINKNIIFF